MQTGTAVDPRAAVAAAVREVLEEEARQNEVRVAVVRVAGWSTIVVLDVVTATMGLRPWGNAPVSAAIAIFAALVLWQMRQAQFRQWYQVAFPLLDFVTLAAVLGPRIHQLGLTTGLAATSALVCGLFAATGALRFSRTATLTTTGLAALLLLVLLGPYARPHELVYSLAALAATGLLALWLADVVRRSMEGAGSRALLQRFLPRELVEGAFHDPMAVLAEARVVEATVLVSDLRGFTSIAERVPPDRVFAFLSDLQGELARIVHQHGGMVDKFMGDGMLAVFGVDGRPDHAGRAIAAARSIRAAVERLDTTNRLGAPVRVGIGIHSGPLVAGCLGSGDRLEWTIIGDTVNTASRLEALTKEKAVDILLSEAVLARAEGLDAEPLGEVNLRGRAQALGILTLRA
jgi:class 3 adenylate cyclase